MSTAQATPTTPRRRSHGRPLKGKPIMETWAEISPAERGDLALLLRADGLSWSQIAERLGYSAGSAAYNAAMRRALVLAPVTEAQRDAARQAARQRLDEIFTILVEPLLNSADAAKRAIGIEQARLLVDRSARLLGVLPSQTPLAERLPQWLEARP